VTAYRDAGVDLEAASRHVDRIRSLVEATWGPGVVGGFGGFAAGVELPPNLRRPVLMLTTDGVGTKLELARRLGRWDGVGFDLVAMCVDDLAAVGARPLGLVDYLAVGRLDTDRDTAILASVAEGCRRAGAPLLGGETAEHPGVMEPDQVDLAGAALGVVERGSEVTGEGIRPGDLVVGLHSPNLRSNGFSLVRRVFHSADLDRQVEATTLGELLLSPSVIYSPEVVAACATGHVRGAAHITGGGIPTNLGRILPEGLGTVIDTSAWDPPTIFELIRVEGRLGPDDMWSVFNMGIGFCLVVDPAGLDRVAELVSPHRPTVIGRVVEGGSRVELT
jgi:phosphoribosylformylglycinamidine cyclo-ligase